MRRLVLCARTETFEWQCIRVQRPSKGWFGADNAPLSSLEQWASGETSVVDGPGKTIPATMSDSDLWGGWHLPKRCKRRPRHINPPQLLSTPTPQPRLRTRTHTPHPALTTHRTPPLDNFILGSPCLRLKSPLNSVAPPSQATPGNPDAQTLSQRSTLDPIIEIRTPARVRYVFRSFRRNPCGS